MCFRLFIFTVVFASISGTQPLAAQLGPYSYHTLEERILNSEIVLMARITEITGIRQHNDRDTYKIAFTTERLFKAPQEWTGRDRRAGSIDYFYLFAKREDIETWIKLKARLVISTPADTFTNSESACVLLDLSQTKLQCLSLGEDGVLRALTSEQDIVSAIKHTAQKLPGVTRIRTYQMTTEEKLVREANLIIQDGYPIAFVPVDKPLETWAKEKIISGGGLPIEHAIRALSLFPSDTNAEWVRREIANRKPSPELAALKGILDDWDSSE